MRRLGAALIGVTLLTCTAAMARPPGSVDAERLKAAAAEPGNWFAAGRDQEGTYYSPLTRINSKNVGKLGFAWQYDLGTYRGQEATPIVVDGVMYTSGTWGYVYAVDAATGKQIWRYDPQATHLAARHPCCDLVNRGVAVWKGRFGPSVTPDLRNLSPGLHASFKDIVLRGAVAPTGMEAFDDVLTEQDVENIHAYLIDQAWKAYK